MVRASARQVFSATRVHFPQDTTELPEVSIKNLVKYALSTQALGISGGIAVNCLQEEVKSVIEEAAPHADIEVLHVPVWGAFVPALNTLLGEAQRRCAKYILFQSLEVVCHPAVLRKLLDFHEPDTLVVGPVLNGHIFTEGRQVLNGRTTPWNTLALWSTRKLGLTGFLSVAEGLPDGSQVTRMLSGEDSPDGRSPGAGAFGSEGWWDGQNVAGGGGVGRMQSLAKEVPAGVEEVTAIALLQHLLGEAAARAVLITLPSSMDDKVSWKTNWGGDKKREEWHEYKMRTKITRPAAQIKKLFGKSARLSAPLLPLRSKDAGAGQHDGADGQLHFGFVHHYRESINPPAQVEAICMACSALFMATFSSAFASAFQAINAGYPHDQTVSTSTMTYVGLLLGGVYLPMPLSLLFIRWLTTKFGQKAGILFFAACMTIAHITSALAHFAGGPEAILVAVRLFEGLSSAVLFQTRFILSQLSTQDKHIGLQAKTFLAGDLGLGLGALLPFVCNCICSMSSLTAGQPETASSCTLMILSLGLWVWVWVSFPQHLCRLSHRVRFPTDKEDHVAPAIVDAVAEPEAAEDGESDDAQLASVARPESDFSSRIFLLMSGTVRVFVQSAALIAAAMCLRDAGEISLFKQSRGVAMLCLIPVPFEALAAGVWLKADFSRVEKYANKASLAALAILLVLCSLYCMGGWFNRHSKDLNTAFFLSVLVLLQICMALAAPLKVSKLYRHKHIERSLVSMEWAKAYIGRLLGPVVALLIHNFFGYVPLLIMLFSGAVVVALTA